MNTAKPLVNDDETLRITSVRLGLGDYGVVHSAEVRPSSGKTREVAVKFFNYPQLSAPHMHGYVKYTNKIPWLQKKYPLLRFNVQQVVPIAQVTSTDPRTIPAHELHLHNFVLVSEIRKNLDWNHGDLDLGKIKIEHVRQLEKFAMDSYKDGMVIGGDAIEFTPTTPTSPFHNIEIRDPDFIAGNVLPLHGIAWRKFKTHNLFSYRDRLVYLFKFLGKIYNKNGSKNDAKQFRKRVEKFFSDMQLKPSRSFDSDQFGPANAEKSNQKALHKLRKKTNPAYRSELKKANATYRKSQ